MYQPEQGRIIKARVEDPQNRNPKVRTLLIVTPSEEIDSADTFSCVAITGTLPKKLPDDCVLLRYHNRGHPQTGLTKRCAAMCSWLVELRSNQIISFVGRVSDRELSAVLGILEKLDP